METRFANRREGGERLGQLLLRYVGPTTVVLALPRGGVPVGYEVARAIRAPLDVYVVRKLGVPGYEELAMGAVASGGTRVINAEVIERSGISQAVIDQVTAREMREIARREAAYRGDRPQPALVGRTVILVDDGLATGSTMRAAIAAVRVARPARLVVAVPVAARETLEDLRREVDDVVCALAPASFSAVGLWYDDFEQTSDEEVGLLLAQAATDQRSMHPHSTSARDHAKPRR